MSSRPRRRCSADAIHVVYGHGGEQVQAGARRRAGELGAAGRAARHRPRGRAGDAGDSGRSRRCSMLYGDVPLVRAATLRAARRAVRTERRSALLTVRARRSDRLRPRRARQRRQRRAHRRGEGCEHQGARDQRDQHRPDGRARGALRSWLAALKNDNAQGEYYLTDCIVMAVRDGMQVERRDRADRGGGAGRERQGAAGSTRSRAARRARATS